VRTFHYSALKHLAALWICSLALTTDRANYKWPPRNDKPYPSVKGKDGDKILHRRWEKASKKPLGTDADTAAIKKVILAHIKEGKQSEVDEIRWLSPALIMADAGWYYGPLASAGYFYIVEKKKGKWEIVTRYMLCIS
jgi:hypothetical protein